MGTNEHTMVASYEQQEDAAFRQEVDSVKQWFTSPRFKGLVRPYTAEQVVSKRGTLPISYPSNEMGKNLDTVYVSGWQSSSTASSTNEPGPDLADYPYNTVPNKVEHLFMAQLFHDRKQREARSGMDA